MEHKPLNLGQGFPDDHAPGYVTEALAAVSKDPNPLLQQYTRGFVSLSLLIFPAAIIILINIGSFTFSSSAFQTLFEVNRPRNQPPNRSSGDCWCI